ncbi:MAG: 1-phosphofructokinase [Anaerolineae bacterium]|jgi:1-phosphofructokinase|nr:1-phosphofructokinase [Chloroflexota bacterium]
MIITVTLNPSLDRTLHFGSVRWGAVNRASRSSLDLSGKGVNVSIALRQLGHPSLLMGLAAGAFGRLLVDGLVERGYACSFVFTEGETRSNVTVIDDGSGLVSKLNEAGPAVSEEALAALDEQLAARVSPGDLVVLAGSLPPGAPPDTYARLAATVQGVGGKVVLDSSGRALANGCRQRPWLVKPNETEAAELVEAPLAHNPCETIALLRQLGPERVLLSLGAQGAAYSDGSGCWLATPPSIREVNNVGAGDAALAGALSAISESLAAADLLRMAVATGTATAGLDGTSFPTRDQVEALLPQVTVQRLGA